MGQHYDRYTCYEMDGVKRHEPGLKLAAHDARGAAENYAYELWWNAGCEGTERKIEVHDEEGAITRWNVTGRAEMFFDAEPTS